LRDMYLSDYNVFKPIPFLAQSISVSVLLLCVDNGQEYALINKRSSRPMLGTGHDLYVLSVNETPRRPPTPDELRILENVRPERLVPDVDAEGPATWRAWPGVVSP